MHRVDRALIRLVGAAVTSGPGGAFAQVERSLGVCWARESAALAVVKSGGRADDTRGLS